MITSLRSQLILSFISVIVLTLCVAGAGLVVLIQPLENVRLTQRLVAALGPAALNARSLILEGNRNPADLVTLIQDQLDDPSWRVLFVNVQRTIAADSSGELDGHPLPQTLSSVVTIAPRRFVTGRVTLGGRDYAYAAAPVGRAGDVRGTLIIASVPRPFIAALEDLATPLAGSGAIALAVSLVIGWFLARSISKPINRLYRATEEIARGNYDHRIDVEGSGEVVRLGSSFNDMARAVKRAQQSQKDLVANISHELKTPLTSIQGFSQAIVEGAVRDLDGARQAARLIYDESRRMGRLVADLLILARLDAEQVTIGHELLDLQNMLPTWIDRFRGRAKDQGLTLQLSIGAAPKVRGDPGRLEQAVSNLIDNAITYNRPGGSITVSLSGERWAAGAPDGTRSLKQAEEWTVVRVSDTGAGIPAAQVPRLFERFYRADPFRATGGSGLGLAIVHEIVSQHGGRVEVQSVEGKGTTFSLWLPGAG